MAKGNENETRDEKLHEMMEEVATLMVFFGCFLMETDGD